MVLADDQGWNGLSTPMDPNVVGALSGSDFYETPNTAAFAAQGMRFRQTYSANPNCSPTRASIITGMSPASLNMTAIVGRGDRFTTDITPGYDLVAPQTAPRLPAGIQSLAQRIEAADPCYVTAHLGKWHVTSQIVRPASVGGPVPTRPGGPTEYGYDVNDGTRGNNPINSPDDAKETFFLSRRAIDFMNARAGAGGDNNPFFLQVSEYAVHESAETLAATQAKDQDKLATNPGVVHPGGTGTNRVKFAGMTENLDTGVGQMLNYLDTTPDPRNPGRMLRDNTYVFYLSDNGAINAETSNLPLYEEKTTSWEGGIRVPFIVRGPGIAGNSVSDVPVVSTDLYATISALAGATAPLPHASESADLGGVLRNGAALADGTALERGVGKNGEIFIHYPHYVRDTTPMSSMIEGDGSLKTVRSYGTAANPTRDYLFDLNRPILSPGDTWETIDYRDPRNLANNPPSPAASPRWSGAPRPTSTTARASSFWSTAPPAPSRWSTSLPGGPTSAIRLTALAAAAASSGRSSTSRRKTPTRPT